MPRAQAQRIASGLKKGVLVASVALFGGFGALAAGNAVGVTAQSSSSSSQSSDSSSQNDDQNSNQNNSNFFGGGSGGAVGSGSSSQQPAQVTNAS